MRLRDSLRPLGFSVLALAFAGCTLIPLSPSLTLSVQSTPYTTSTVSIPYSFASLSINAGFGSAQCAYKLTKWSPSSGSYQQIQSSITSLPKKGALTFNIDQLLGVNAGSPVVDGLYHLTFEVLNGSYNQAGEPEAIPYLVKSADFSIYTSSGPEIFKTTPVVVNTTKTSQTVALLGEGFSSGDNLAVQSGPMSLTSSSYVSATKMTAVLAPSATTGSGGPVELSVTGSASQSPLYTLPAVGNLTVSAIVPASGSNRQARQPVYIAGSSLGYWTKVVVTGPNGTTTLMAIESATGTELFGYLDLTSLAAGAATITVANPNSSATAAFTVYN